MKIIFVVNSCRIPSPVSFLETGELFRVVLWGAFSEKKILPVTFMWQNAQKLMKVVPFILRHRLWLRIIFAIYKKLLISMMTVLMV